MFIEFILHDGDTVVLSNVTVGFILLNKNRNNFYVVCYFIYAVAGGAETPPVPFTLLYISKATKPPIISAKQ